MKLTICPDHPRRYCPRNFAEVIFWRS